MVLGGTGETMQRFLEFIRRFKHKYLPTFSRSADFSRTREVGTGESREMKEGSSRLAAPVEPLARTVLKVQYSSSGHESLPREQSREALSESFDFAQDGSSRRVLDWAYMHSHSVRSNDIRFLMKKANKALHTVTY